MDDIALAVIVQDMVQARVSGVMFTANPTSGNVHELVISSLYGAEMPTELAKRHEFEGEFQGRLPADITDGGWYLYQAVPMGSISAYIEHVGGARKISWDLETRELSLNRLVDVWLAWLDTEFASDARYPRFREFVDVVVRDDLRNISLYLWAFDTAGLVSSASAGDEEEEQLVEDFIFRAGIYLAERGYFDPEEIPELIRGFAVAEDEHLPEHFLTALMRGLATKLGTPTDDDGLGRCPECASAFALAEYDRPAEGDGDDDDSGS